MNKTEDGMVDPQEIFSKIFGGGELSDSEIANWLRGFL